MTLCACGCGLPARPRGVYYNRAHYLRGGGPAKSGRTGGWSKSKARERDALWRIAEQLGSTPTLRDARMFRAGRITGYNLGHRRGLDIGYRRGWAEALRERQGAA